MPKPIRSIKRILAVAVFLLLPASAFAEDAPPAAQMTPQPPPPGTEDYVAPPTADEAHAPLMAPEAEASHVLAVPQKTQTPVLPPPGMDDSMKPITVGTITYITGGIGQDEQQALKAVEKKYNLHILMSMKDGHFIADARIVIRDKKGNQLLDVETGPMFYASLPAGKYTVEVSHDGQTKKEPDVNVGKEGTNSEKSYYAFSW